MRAEAASKRCGLAAAAAVQPQSCFKRWGLAARSSLRAPKLLQSSAAVQPASPQQPLSTRAASKRGVSATELARPHRLETALALKVRCRLPARSAWKQLLCSKTAAGCKSAPLGSTAWKQLSCSKASGCQPAPLGSSFGAQRPLRAASPHRFGAQEAPSKATAGCQPAPLGAGKPLRDASLHRLEAALVIERRLRSSFVAQGRCRRPARTAWKQL